MTLSYREQLQHPLWQRRRLEILSRDSFMCRRCCAVDKPLHVHHIFYERGRMAWEYEDHLLRTLCAECHTIEHSMKATIDGIAESVGLEATYELMALVFHGKRDAAIAKVHEIIADGPHGREG